MALNRTEAETLACAHDQPTAFVAPPPPSLRLASAAVRERKSRLAAFLLVDVIAIALGSGAASVGSYLGGARGSYLWLVAFDVLAFLSLRHRGFYRFRLRPTLLDHTAQLVAGTATTATIILAARALVSPDPSFGEQTVRLWVFVTAYLAVGRIALAVQGARTPQGPRNSGTRLPTLIVGAQTVGALVAARLLEQPRFGLRPVGFLEDDAHLAAADLPLPVLGTTDDLEARSASHHIAHIVVCFSATSPSVLLEVVRRARRLGLGVSFLPRLYEEVSGRVEVGHVGGIPLLQVEQPDPKGWRFGLKYAADRAFAVVALAVISPLLGLIALAVRASSPGPVLYRQRRVGLDGQQFDILKFRTMYDDPEARREPDGRVAAAMLDQQSPAILGDRRTPIGRLLRRLSLDELPQLVNVARGEMSLVGPRPERPSLVDAFEHHVYRYGARHRVKSGITGWAQVNGLRGRSSLADRVEWDNHYIENWSFWLDVKILLLTIPALIRGRNAE